MREIAALYENFHKIGHGSAPPSARDVTNTNRRKKAPAATTAGATGRRQWFAGLAATQQF
ncbi:MAG: hypothetical protein WBL48_02075 [Pseudolabrys sp.]